MTDPQTCCQGMLVTLWVFSNLATQWRGHQVHNKWHQTRHPGQMCKTITSSKRKWGKLSDNSRKQSISQNQLKDCPLTKQDILHVYSDVFTGIGKFPGMPYKFQLKENAKPTRHAPRKVPIHLQDAFHSEIHNLEKLGILEETKDVTEWVNSFVIMEKKTPDVSNSQSGQEITDLP